MRKLFNGRLAIFIALVLFALLYYSECLAFDDGDFQYWNTESISWRINKLWQLTLEEEFRFGDDAGNPYYRHSDLGATYSGIADWLDIGINYRQILEERSGDWKYENQPQLNTTVKFKLSDFTCSTRSRFEYRNREDADNFWQYANKLTVNLPLKLTRLEIQPYLADEIFVDFDQEELSRNRLYAGFSLKLLQSLKGELFYLWQRSKKSGKWSDCHVFGSKLKFSF